MANEETLAQDKIERPKSPEEARLTGWRTRKEFAQLVVNVMKKIASPGMNSYSESTILGVLPSREKGDQSLGAFLQRMDKLKLDKQQLYPDGRSLLFSPRAQLMFLVSLNDLAIDSIHREMLIREIVRQLEDDKGFQFNPETKFRKNMDDEDVMILFYEIIGSRGLVVEKIMNKVSRIFREEAKNPKFLEMMSLEDLDQLRSDIGRLEEYVNVDYEQRNKILDLQLRAHDIIVNKRTNERNK